MTVLNKHYDKIPPDAIYIGRGSKWGNEYSHKEGTKAKFKVATRDEACDKHKDDLWNKVKAGEVTIEDLAGLYGKDLVCFCKPSRCHGDTLEKAAAWAFAKLQESK